MRIDWTKIDDRRFEQLCHELVRQTLPPNARALYQPSSVPFRADGQRDGVLATAPFEGLEPPIFFSFKTSDPGAKRGASKAITAEFIRPERLKVLLAGNPRSIVLLANHDIAEGDRQRIRDKIGGAASIRIEGRSQLEHRLLQHPYLLSRYFAWSEFVECVHSEDLETLWKLLPESGGALATAVPHEGLHHPAIADAQALGRRLRILGGPGSGKSFFVYQLLKQLRPSLVLVLRSLDREVMAPIRDIAAWAELPLVVLVDNLHRSLTPTAPCDAFPLLFESSDLASKVIATFITYWTSMRLEVEARVPSTTWRHWGFSEICLDDPPRDFIRGVVDAACSHLEIRADEAIRNAFVESVVDCENTPACAIAAVAPYAGKVLDSSLGFYPIEIRERELDWHHLFEDVTRNDPVSKSVLRTLAILRISGLPRPAAELLVHLLSKLEGIAAGEITGALERLQIRRWLRLGREGVFGHDLQLAPRTVRLYDEQGPSLFLRQFADSMKTSVLSEVSEFRRAVLHGLTHLFWQAGDIETCAQLNALLVEEDPKDQRARTHLGLCRIREGQVDEGLTELRATISVQPELRLFTLYLRQCLRHGRGEAAVASLDDLAAQRPSDPDTMAFLAHGYADVREPRKGLLWARRVAKVLPDDPRSAALLAELLWLSGGRRKQARTTLERGLARWPTDGHLLGVKAIFDLQEGLAESALEAASAALQAQPNEVRNHSLVAILQFQLSRFEEARNTVELGRRLFSEWPELLAVDGLLLLEADKVSDAGRCLRQALVHEELLGSIMRPSIFQALGRIALLEGKGEEATRWFDEARSHGVPALHILRLRVGVHEERGDPSAAISELEAYLSRHDAEAQLWTALGRLLSKTGRHLESAEAMRRACELDSQDAENFLALGVELFLAGDSAQALPNLETGIKLGPQDPRVAALLLVDCLIDLHRPAEAAQAFGQADRLAPLSDAERLRYAYALAVGGDPEAALGQVERVLGERSEHFPALSAKALFLLQAGRQEMAKEAAVVAKANWPSSEEGATGLAQILADVGLIEDALNIWQVARREGWRQFALSREAIYKATHMLAAQSRLQEMLDLLEYCEQAHGFDEATDLNIAHVLSWLGRGEESLSRYNQLLQRSPLLINAVIERALLLNKLGRVAEALSLESEIYDELPPWLRYLYLAHVHAWAANRNPPLFAGGLQTAAEELLRCAAVLPDPPPTGVLEMPALAEAVVHLGVGELIEAAARRRDDECDPKTTASALYLAAFLAAEEGGLHCRLQLAHERDPERVTLLGNLARAEGRAGDHAAALAHARALACHPRAGCWGLGRAAEVLLEAGAPPEEALETADRAIAAAAPGDHSLPGGLHAKARALSAMTRWDEALEAAQAALSGRDAPNYVATVAYCYAGLGRHNEALKVVEKGLRHHPGDAKLSVAKADLLKSTGRYSDCLAFVNEMAEEGRLLPLPLIEVAEGLLNQDRHEEALSLALRARELIDQAEPRGDEAISQAPAQADSQLLRWRVRALAAMVSSLLGLGRSQTAMEELEALDRGILLSTLLWLGKAQILRDGGRAEELLALARARLDVEPKDHWAHTIAAEALLSLDRVEEALHETELGLKETQQDEALFELRALALARCARYEEAVLTIARAMAASLIAGNQVSSGHGKLAAAWLPQCNEPPLVGFWLVVSVLGIACGTVGERRVARQMLRLIEGTDLSPLQSAALTGDPVSSTAVEVLERAQRFLQGEPSPPSKVRKEPAESQEHDPHWATLDSLLRFLSGAEWPRRRSRRHQSHSPESA